MANTPGIVKVFCHLHSHMSAIVRVFDHPYFTIPGHDGRFTIPDIPPGQYEITAWHERAGQVSATAVVTAGDTTNVQFSLPLRSTE